MSFKNLLRSAFNFFHLDVTKNLEYDRLTKLVIKKVVTPNTNTIDVGCHKGEILDMILAISPNGKHFGFEPLPHLNKNLQEKYKGKATILPYALSDTEGTSTFNFVKNAPAYSGIKKRKYATDNPDVEEIEVELKRLDEVIPTDIKIDLIKIDVEGAEFMVLKGAKELLLKNKPAIIFECGIGASEFYGTNPVELYTYLTKEVGLKLSLLKSFIHNKPALTQQEFETCYNTNKEYYFIAY
jgi:FkbM family methyltransferase